MHFNWVLVASKMLALHTSISQLLTLGFEALRSLKSPILPTVEQEPIRVT
jgi:hypothetical protein